MSSVANPNGSLSKALRIALFVSASYACIALAADIKVSLSGDQEVPPVKTSASGSGTIKINDDKSVSGSVTTTGVTATAAHIHEAPPGKNGPVIVPLTKGADNNSWSVAPGAKLTDAQFASFKSGALYINVHSAANPGGEIRGQLKP